VDESPDVSHYRITRPYPLITVIDGTLAEAFDYHSLTPTSWEYGVTASMFKRIASIYEFQSI